MRYGAAPKPALCPLLLAMFALVSNAREEPCSLSDTVQAAVNDIAASQGWPSSGGAPVPVSIVPGPIAGAPAMTVGPPVSITISEASMVQRYGEDSLCNKELVTAILLHELDHVHDILNGTTSTIHPHCDEAETKINDLQRTCDLACEMLADPECDPDALADLCAFYENSSEFLGKNAAVLALVCGIVTGYADPCPCCP